MKLSLKMTCPTTTDSSIQRDSLVTMKCKRGQHESIAKYQVCNVHQNYNKWFIAPEGKFLWDKTSKNVWLLRRMVKKHRSAYEEVRLERNGSFRPTSIFCMILMCEVLNVESVLEDY